MSYVMEVWLVWRCIQWNLFVATTTIIKFITCDLFSELNTEGTNFLLLTISAFWSSSRWPLDTQMSSRRQRSIPLGCRYRQVSLYLQTSYIFKLYSEILLCIFLNNTIFPYMPRKCNGNNKFRITSCWITTLPLWNISAISHCFVDILCFEFSAVTTGI